MSPWRLVLAWWCLLMAAILVAYDVARWSLSFAALLAVVLLVVWLWGLGGFRRSFWIGVGPEGEVTGLDRLEEDGTRTGGERS